MTGGPAPVQLPARLPPLREDLQLHPAATGPDGSLTWTIQDPLANTFYRIGWLEFELLARWSLDEPARLLEAVAAETPLEVGEEELAVLYGFLLGHQLLDIHNLPYSRQLYAQHRARRTDQGRLKWLLHNYLFFRIPLVHPDRFLHHLLPWVEWLYGRTFWVLMLGLSTLGLLLTARQWDSFSASFVDTLSPGGILGYLLALALTKTLHELGHALTATRYGLRVAHMGVAFLVLWPVLYTDTGESWRLAARRQRLAIASAGMVTELLLAGLATLAWNLTAEGDLKQALFFLASTAWVVSLLFNISPFMRFDGYFILTDLLDLPNLHARSSALALNALRNTLLGWGEPVPEVFPGYQRRLLTAFAYGTWLYRLLLFLGIAVAVYVFFFKLLGILLFAVEILWFVVIPVMKELRVWHGQRQRTLRSRRWLLAVVPLLLLSLLLLPLDRALNAPGWAHVARQYGIYSPLPARLLQLPADVAVTAGETLFVLEQPELDYRRQLAVEAEQALEQRLRGLASLPDGEETRTLLQEQQHLQRARQLAEQAESGRLHLRAPFAGVLLDLDPELASGQWISPRRTLAILVDPSVWEVELFVSQQDVGRLAKGHGVRFYPDAQGEPHLDGEIVQIDQTRAARLPHALLASRHGGDIPVLEGNEGLVPRDPLYRVLVRLSGTPQRTAVLSGQAHVQAEPESWLLARLKPVLIVLIREAGF